jgi:hypothetical protein
MREDFEGQSCADAVTDMATDVVSKAHAAIWNKRIGTPLK